MAPENRAVRVKVCGITRPEDAAAAVSAGVHALGFIFHPASPRYISPKGAAEIIASLPPFVCPVGVFVNLPKDQVESIVKISAMHMIQLHGDETPDECAGYSRPLIKAFRLSQTDLLPDLSEFRVAGLLVDAAVDGQWGGTGMSLDWKLLGRRLTNLPNSVRSRLVLAGGLNSENVADALNLIEPFGVDVSTGVEDEPGIKNHKKIKEFVDAVRSSKKISRMA